MNEQPQDINSTPDYLHDKLGTRYGQDRIGLCPDCGARGLVRLDKSGLVQIIHTATLTHYSEVSQRLSVGKAAALIGVGRMAINMAIRAGRLPAQHAADGARGYSIALTDLIDYARDSKPGKKPIAVLSSNSGQTIVKLDKPITTIDRPQTKRQKARADRIHAQQLLAKSSKRRLTK